jgi:hypothetical protein
LYVQFRAVQHAHATDRFAREIKGILTAFGARSRRLMGIPFGNFNLSPFFRE